MRKISTPASSLVAELQPQHVLQDGAAERGRALRVQLRVVHVCGHHQVEVRRLLGDRLVRHPLALAHPVEVLVALGQRHVAVEAGVPVSREVLAAGDDRVVVEPTDDRSAEVRDLGRIRRDRAIADDRVLGVAVDVEHRREVQVEPRGGELPATHGAHLVGEGHRVDHAELRHLREDGERLRQPMHRAPLLVDADERRDTAAERPELLRQIQDLIELLEVPAEQDDAAEAPLLVHADEVVRQPRALEANDETLADTPLELPKVGHEVS
jgi:hypothetical protein